MTSREEKQRRKALRKSAGGGAVDTPGPVTDPSGDYLVAHACFDCRKSFKIRPREDPASCPRCLAEIYWMGRSFKAPKTSDVEQWRKVQALYAHGFRFFSYRSYPRAALLPDRYRDVAEFVERNPDHPFRVAPPIPALRPRARET